MIPVSPDPVSVEPVGLNPGAARNTGISVKPAAMAINVKVANRTFLSF